MGAKSRGRSSDRGPYSSCPLTAARGRSLRAALLAGASVIALAALGAPGAALACSGANQTISTVVSGPILSTGGSITVLKTGTVDGAPTGVNALSCSISTLTSNGSIFGGAGATDGPGFAGVSNSQTITTLTNSGTISGGAGGSGYAPGAGGAGVSNAGHDHDADQQRHDQRRSGGPAARPSALGRPRAARACRTPARSRR